jgi:hypothetical protein
MFELRPAALLLGIVGGESLQRRQEGWDLLDARSIGIEIGLITGDHEAALAALGILDACRSASAVLITSMV